MDLDTAFVFISLAISSPHPYLFFFNYTVMLLLHTWELMNIRYKIYAVNKDTFRNF